MVSRLTAGLICIALTACGGGGGSPDNAVSPTSGSGAAGTDGSGGAGTGTTGTTGNGATPGQGTGTGSTPQSSPPSGGTDGTGNTGGTGGTGNAGTGGTGDTGNTGSTANATDARFNRPIGLARDAAGNMYVADSGNYTIRKISPAGNVSTLAGSAGSSGTADGTGSAARFSFLKGLSVDGAGNIYVVDGNAVRRISPTGAVTTLAGVVNAAGSANGTGAAARFSQPWGIAVDPSGVAYVADTENYVVRRVAADGTVSTYAGTPGSRGTVNGSTASATFLGPKGIARDASGNLYVTDWFGPPAPMTSETSTFIRRIGSDGVVSTMAGNFGGETGPAQFRDTFAITADNAGNAYVSAFNRVQRISAAGAVSTVAGPIIGYQSLEGITIDAEGNLYVADTPSHAISRVTQAGAVTVVAGKQNEAGSTDVP
jgi:hypothetical protein